MDQRQYEVLLADAELRLRRLRTLYDHWFHGIERTEPQQQRGEVERMIQELRRQPQRNTALRFRFNQLVQRYTTFNTYWQRIARQIEEGTYKRDVLRAKRRVGGGRDNPRDSQASARDSEQDIDMDVDVDVDAALAALKTDPPPAATTPADSVAPPPSSRPPGERTSPPPRAITPFALPSQSAAGARPPLPQNVRGSTLQGVPGAPARTAGVVVPGAPPLPPPMPAGAARAPAPPPPLGLSRPPGPLPAPPAAARVASLGGTAPGHRGGASSPHAPVPRAAPPANSNGMSEQQIARIYERYVEARRQNAERTDNVRIETVAKTVRDMLPKLAEKHAGKSIDFEVVLKDGRVALKPVAK